MAVSPNADAGLLQDRDFFLHAPCGALDVTDAYGNTCTHGKETFTGANGASSTYPTDGDTYPTLGTMSFTSSGDNAYYGYTPYTYPHPLRGESETVPPQVTAFSLPETASSLTVSISEFTATDDSGTVTGYLLTESADTPDVDDPDWSGTAQTDYTFSSEGAKTLYAWAKDAAGNISTSLNDSVTITLETYTIGGTISGLTGTAVLQNNGGDDLTVSSNGSFTFGTALHDSDTYDVIVSDQPEDQTCGVTNGTGTISAANVTNISVTCEDGADSTAPTVTAFSIPSTSDSLTVSITEFTATDDTAVTGYLLTESAATPDAGDSGWEVTALDEYTFSSEGAKTLYAWAKDGSGNVSVSLSDEVTITLSGPDDSEDDNERDLDIHGIKCNSTASTIAIEWKTDYNAKSTIRYGTDRNLKEKKKDDDKEKKHKVTLTSLLPDTPYYFRIKSEDGDDNEDKSKIHSIRTKSQSKSNQDSFSKPQGSENIQTSRLSYSGNPTPKTCSYTVEAGDTLWQIAQKVYGDPAAYPLIIEKNKDRYPNIASVLIIGQELSFGCENKTGTEDVQGASDTKNYDDDYSPAPSSDEIKTQESTFKWWNPFSWY